MLVVIDEDDYRSVFKSQSPLAAQGIFNIIQAILKGNPKVVGVDLDTSQWVLREDIPRGAGSMTVKSRGCPMEECGLGARWMD